MAMNSKEASIQWRNLARFYHNFGFNIVPLGADKRPVVSGVSRTSGAPLRFRWEDWATMVQSEKLFNEMLQPAWWADVQGIAAICGNVSGKLLCLDFDHCPESTLRTMMNAIGLPHDYDWTVKTPGNGFHLWIRVADDSRMPEKGKERRGVEGHPDAFIELRWSGHYTALPGSMHPRGTKYEWLNKEPKEAPWIL